MVKEAVDWKKIENADEGRKACGGARTVGGKPDTAARPGVPEMKKGQRFGGGQGGKSGSPGT